MAEPSEVVPMYCFTSRRFRSSLENDILTLCTVTLPLVSSSVHSISPMP